MSQPSSSTSQPCINLVLDAGPLLSLSPIRGLAQTYLTTPQILSELRDNRAREHFQQLGLTAGVKIEVRSPGPVSLAHVIQFSKRTGDYSVLSPADLSILALTYELSEEAKKKEKAEKEDNGTREESADPEPSGSSISTSGNQISTTDQLDDPTDGAQGTEDAQVEPKLLAAPEEETLEPLDVELVREDDSKTPSLEDPSAQPEESNQIPDDDNDISISDDDDDRPIYDDPSSSDDGEGEWITPSNVSLHKSRALDLLPSPSDSSKASRAPILVGCMTADFAMQNVILQMGLSLVGNEGKRIERVKTWVLRCHACFKICKDNTKKFCPSCGNPTLLRASVTISSPTASSSSPIMQVHLKRNFQYRTRGTKYSIPAPKPGSAKTGSGEGLILREDQAEYLRAKGLADGKRERQEKKMIKGIFNSNRGGGVAVGSWMDPDWVPEIMSVGAGGKGRSVRAGGNRVDREGMPVIGHGRKNPNERRRKA